MKITRKKEYKINILIYTENSPYSISMKTNLSNCVALIAA